MSKSTKKCVNCAWRKKRAIKPPFAKEIPGHPRFLCSFTSRTVELEDSCSNWVGYYGEPIQLYLPLPDKEELL